MKIKIPILSDLFDFQEIIGGLLNLDVRKWKRPRVEQNPIPKVKQFADWWKPFDITVTEQ